MKRDKHPTQVAVEMAGKDRDVWFLLLPHVHLLDLAGPVQVFFEAAGQGAPYRLRFVGGAPNVRSAQGLGLAGLEPLPKRVAPSDLVIVPGMESSTLDDLSAVPGSWLRQAVWAGATVCSICSGAFALAQAGVLNGRRCTTHWKVAAELARRFPAARVVENRLFVTDANVVTSAGIASGIDTALWLVERDHGPMVVARVAREMVVYLRRDGAQPTESIYLDFRTHLHPGIHRVQDWLIAHPERRATIDELASIAGMSPRNLTRVFRQATGTTLKDFSTRLKLELARTLLHNPDLTVDSVAAQCGFKDPRQLRRLWKQHHGESPSIWKEHAIIEETGT